MNLKGYRLFIEIFYVHGFFVRYIVWRLLTIFLTFTRDKLNFRNFELE